MFGLGVRGDLGGSWKLVNCVGLGSSFALQ